MNAARQSREHFSSMGSNPIEASANRVSSKISNMGLVCACMVVLIHVPRAGGDFAWWMNRILQMGICKIAVPFFFIVSGYFLSKHFYECGWWEREVVKRMRSIVVPFIVWTSAFTLMTIAAYVAMNVHKGLPFFERITPSFVINSLGFNPLHLPGNEPLWYVRALFGCVLISPLLKKFATKLGLAILFSAYCIVCPDWSSGNNVIRYGLLQGPISLFAIFFFTLGIYLRGKSFNALTCGWCLILAFLGATFVMLRCVFERRGEWFVPFYILCWLPVVWQLVPSKSFGPVAKYSFPIFLMHFFFTSSVINHPMRWLSASCGYLGTIAGWLLTLLVCLLCGDLIMRMSRISAIVFGGRVKCQRHHCSRRETNMANGILHTVHYVESNQGRREYA